jgi:hypothetical protein
MGITQIKVVWTEGYVEHAEMLEGRVFSCVESWAPVFRFLCSVAPHGGSYNKCRIAATYHDGRTEEGRIDVQPGMADPFPAAEWHGGRSVDVWTEIETVQGKTYSVCLTPGDDVAIHLGSCGMGKVVAKGRWDGDRGAIVDRKGPLADATFAQAARALTEIL